eukprot:g40228.t1
MNTALIWMSWVSDSAEQKGTTKGILGTLRSQARTKPFHQLSLLSLLSNFSNFPNFSVFLKGVGSGGEWGVLGKLNFPKICMSSWDYVALDSGEAHLRHSLLHSAKLAAVLALVLFGACAWLMRPTLLVYPAVLSAAPSTANTKNGWRTGVLQDQAQQDGLLEQQKQRGQAGEEIAAATTPAVGSVVVRPMGMEPRGPGPLHFAGMTVNVSDECPPVANATLLEPVVFIPHGTLLQDGQQYEYRSNKMGYLTHRKLDLGLAPTWRPACFLCFQRPEGGLLLDSPTGRPTGVILCSIETCECGVVK